jgi:hypothetical protein
VFERVLQDGGGILALVLVSSAPSVSGRLRLQRRRRVGSMCLGVGRRCSTGLVQGMVRRDIWRGRWLLVGGSATRELQDYNPRCVEYYFG